MTDNCPSYRECNDCGVEGEKIGGYSGDVRRSGGLTKTRMMGIDISTFQCPECGKRWSA